MDLHKHIAKVAMWFDCASNKNDQLRQWPWPEEYKIKTGSDFYYPPQTDLSAHPHLIQLLIKFFHGQEDAPRTVNLMILVMVRFVWKLIHTRRLLVRNFAHHCGGYVLLWLLRVWPVSQSQLVWVSKKLWVSLLQNSSKVNKKTNDPHQIISCFRKRKLRPDRAEREREKEEDLETIMGICSSLSPEKWRHAINAPQWCQAFIRCKYFTRLPSSIWSVNFHVFTN